MVFPVGRRKILGSRNAADALIGAIQVLGWIFVYL